jgi:hypothetical protein
MLFCRWPETRSLRSQAADVLKIVKRTLPRKRLALVADVGVKNNDL